VGLSALFIAAGYIVNYVSDLERQEREAKLAATSAAAVKAWREKMKVDAPKKIEEAKASLAAGDIAHAGEVAKAYETFPLPEFKDLAKQVKAVKRKQDLDKARAQLKNGDHLAAMKLAEPYGLFPDPEAQQIMTAARKAGEASKAKIAALDRARRRKEGVTIGMFKDDVLLSSWGRPESINVTRYAFGTHEQWVYPGSQYLYFEDDRLTTIQNHR
jgi:hypothetical protein